MVLSEGLERIWAERVSNNELALCLFDSIETEVRELILGKKMLGEIIE
jgi:hypothetical protein